MDSKTREKWFRACSDCRINEIKMLVESGRVVNVNTLNRKGNTGLMECSAFYSSAAEVVAYLVSVGARVDIKNPFTGDSVLTRILENGPGMPHLFKICETLLEAPGSDVNIRNKARDTPLMLALRYPRDSKTELIQLLLKWGADVNAKNLKDETALMYLAQWKYACITDIVRMLVNAGANVNAQDYMGRTALMREVYDWNSDAVSSLIENGASIHITDNHNNTVIERFYDRYRWVPCYRTREARLIERILKKEDTRNALCGWALQKRCVSECNGAFREWYFTPGNPGAVSAQTHFETMLSDS